MSGSYQGSPIPQCHCIGRLGLGREIVGAAERTLKALGCPKVNLQVRSSNEEVIAFYKKLGFEVEERVSMGKRLIPDA